MFLVLTSSFHANTAQAATTTEITPAFTHWPDAAAITHFVAEMKERHGLDSTELAAAFEATHPNPAVLKFIAPPTDPRVKSWERYRARFITRQRVQNGVQFWQKNVKTLSAAETEFGVPAAVIVAIIGVETEYGQNTGRFETFEALATLAFAYPPRANFFRSELEQLILLSRDNHMPLRSLLGSYAGAIGVPQFMPGSQRRFAVDFDRDGKVDLMRSTTDAIGSVASFLKAHGWIAGQEITTRAPNELPEEATFIANGIKPAIDQNALARHNLPLDTRPKLYPTALIDLVTPDAATEFWWGYQNFYVLTRYNRSSFYAMSVAQLAEAIDQAKEHPLSSSPKATPKKTGRVKPRHR